MHLGDDHKVELPCTPPVTGSLYSCLRAIGVALQVGLKALNHIEPKRRRYKSCKQSDMQNTKHDGTNLIVSVCGSATDEWSIHVVSLKLISAQRMLSRWIPRAIDDRLKYIAGFTLTVFFFNLKLPTHSPVSEFFIPHKNKRKQK